MLSSYTVRLEDHPDPATEEAIRDGLAAFNRRHTPAGDEQSLVITLRDEAGGMVGGLLASTNWGWLYVDILWIEERARRAGHGSALLAAAEAEAVRRGCRHAHLHTTEWQALPFYRKHGYVVWGVLDDYPEGHTAYFVKKQLAP
jgi:GNAT superfamily N-acetyltransferase